MIIALGRNSYYIKSRLCKLLKRYFIGFKRSEKKQSPLPLPPIYEWHKTHGGYCRSGISDLRSRKSESSSDVTKNTHPSSLRAFLSSTTIVRGVIALMCQNWVSHKLFSLKLTGLCECTRDARSQTDVDHCLTITTSNTPSAHNRTQPERTQIEPFKIYSLQYISHSGLFLHNQSHKPIHYKWCIIKAAFIFRTIILPERKYADKMMVSTSCVSTWSQIHRSHKRHNKVAWTCLV